MQYAVLGASISRALAVSIKIPPAAKYLLALYSPVCGRRGVQQVNYGCMPLVVAGPACHKFCGLLPWPLRHLMSVQIHVYVRVCGRCVCVCESAV